MADAAYIIEKSDWRDIETLDNWLWIYDHLPRRMRFVVDLKISGLSNTEIAARCKISLREVQKKLAQAKKRFLLGEVVRFKE